MSVEVFICIITVSSIITLIGLVVDANRETIYQQGKVTGKKINKMASTGIKYFLSIEYSVRVFQVSRDEFVNTLNKDVQVTEEVYNNTNIDDNFRILLKK